MVTMPTRRLLWKIGSAPIVRPPQEIGCLANRQVGGTSHDVPEHHILDSGDTLRLSPRQELGSDHSHHAPTIDYDQVVYTPRVHLCPRTLDRLMQIDRQHPRAHHIFDSHVPLLRQISTDLSDFALLPCV